MWKEYTKSKAGSNHENYMWFLLLFMGNYFVLNRFRVKLVTELYVLLVLQNNITAKKTKRGLLLKFWGEAKEAKIY